MTDRKLNSLADILEAIIGNEIQCGINKPYCFVMDEDGRLVFLKRNDDPNVNPIQKEIDSAGEDRDQFPLNESDGEKLWSMDTGESRGLEITGAFLDALRIEYLG